MESEDTFKINLMTLTGKNIRVLAKASDSVDTIRRKVQAVEGIPVDLQVLTYAGRRLVRSYFQVFGSMLNPDGELVSELGLESCPPATVHFYIPEIEVLKKGQGQSWETRRFLMYMGRRDEYEVVRTVPAQWRTLTVSSEESIRTLMSAIESEYRDAYIPKSTLTSQQVAAEYIVCPECTWSIPIAETNCIMCDTANPTPYVDPTEYAFARMEFVPMAGRISTVVNFTELYKHDNESQDIKFHKPQGDEKASWMISLERPVQWHDEGERATLADYNIQANATLHIILNLRGD